MATRCRVPNSVVACVVTGMAAYLRPGRCLGSAPGPVGPVRGACTVGAASARPRAAAGWRALTVSARRPGVASAGGAVLGVGYLGKPGHRVASEGLVDRDEVLA